MKPQPGVLWTEQCTPLALLPSIPTISASTPAARPGKFRYRKTLNNCQIEKILEIIVSKQTLSLSLSPSLTKNLRKTFLLDPKIYITSVML